MLHRRAVDSSSDRQIRVGSLKWRKKKENKKKVFSADFGDSLNETIAKSCCGCAFVAVAATATAAAAVAIATIFANLVLFKCY